MVSIRVSENLGLEIITHCDSDKIFDLVEKNRAYLAEYMSWVETSTSTDDIKTFINSCFDQLKNMSGICYKVLVDGETAGTIGFFVTNEKTATFEIGYWIAQEYSGRGIVSRLVPIVEKICFEQYKAGKIEIRCATENSASNRVAQKNNYELEGIIRRCEIVNRKYLDYNVYGKCL
jgi:ribosomal-protein-serine acetyltransferase